MKLAGKTAIIDLDDTLASLRDVVMESLNELTGRNSHWSTWEELKVETLYGLEGVDTFLEIAHEQKLLEKSRPHPETVSFMHRLFDGGISTTILTARGWHPGAERITRHWLGLYGIPYNSLKVCQLHECKADYIRHTKNVLFTIDDSMKHCNAYNAMKKNRPEFVFAYAMKWNEGVDDGVIRINNLHDVGNYIEGL